LGGYPKQRSDLCLQLARAIGGQGMVGRQLLDIQSEGPVTREDLIHLQKLNKITSQIMGKAFFNTQNSSSNYRFFFKTAFGHTSPLSLAKTGPSPQRYAKPPCLFGNNPLKPTGQPLPQAMSPMFSLNSSGLYGHLFPFLHPV